MCKYCDELVKCPVGEKRKVVLSDGTINVEMVLDKYPDTTETFIHAEFTDADNRWHNSPFDISYCPMCGRKLKTAMPVEEENV